MKFKDGALPHLLKDRLKYLYRFQEMLIVFHNKEGKKFRDGKISEETFTHFQRGWVRSRNLLICQNIGYCRGKIPELIENGKLPVEEQKNVIGKYKAAKYDETIIIDITDMEEDDEQ